MRKLETKQQRDKKDKRKQVILSLVLVLLLVFSTAGWALNSFSNPGETVIAYNDVEFIAQDNIWLLDYIGQTFGFTYLPTALGDVSINISKGMGDYYNQPIYYTNESQGMFELSRNLQNVALRFQEACIDECEADIPVKNCSVDSVIVFQEGDVNRVYEDEKCIYIEGNGAKGADKFLYQILGI